MEYKLEHVEWQDIDDVLEHIQQSFNICFQEQDFVNVKNFGDLCDLVHEKVDLEHRDDCTSQQAFDKLKNALSRIFKIEEGSLTPETLISTIIPRKNRIKKLKLLEQELDMKLYLLSPPGWITLALIVIFLLSLLAFFFSWKIAVMGLAFSFAGFWISRRLGREIYLNTIGELITKMTSQYYLKSRKDPNTVNRAELNDVIRSLFIGHLGLEPEELHRESEFGTI